MLLLPLLGFLQVLGASGRSVVALAPTRDDSAAFVRVNQVGYLPDAPKVAVVCALRSVSLDHFTAEDERGRSALGPLPARRDGALGPCVETWRLDFSALKRPGLYRIRAGAFVSGPVLIQLSCRPSSL